MDQQADGYSQTSDLDWGIDAGENTPIRRTDIDKCHWCQSKRAEVHCAYECSGWSNSRNEMNDEAGKYEKLALTCVSWVMGKNGCAFSVEHQSKKEEWRICRFRVSEESRME